MEFEKYLQYARDLSFEAPPDYLYLRRLFRKLFKTNDFGWDSLYDWTMMKQKPATSTAQLPSAGITAAAAAVAAPVGAGGHPNGHGTGQHQQLSDQQFFNQVAILQQKQQQSRDHMGMPAMQQLHQTPSYRRQFIESGNNNSNSGGIQYNNTAGGGGGMDYSQQGAGYKDPSGRF